MEERSLKITGADKNFFNKISMKLTKMLTPTKLSINSMLITLRRNSMLKAFEQYDKQEEIPDVEEKEKKYDSTYENYLEALDKYVMDSIYKKVKNGTASNFEKDALTRYYGVVSLKDKEHIEYKYRKQKYLIELDYESIKVSGKQKAINRYNYFYVDKMDKLYKGILKNYSIRLADSTNIYDQSKDEIYNNIFSTLDEYVENVLSIKIEENKDEYKKIIQDFEEYEKFKIGKLDERDRVEKNILLINISREIFTHSLPLVVAEQCFEKLLRETRMLLQNTKVVAKRQRIFETLMKIFEEYKIKLLETKVYWEKTSEKNAYKDFVEKFKEVSKFKDEDFVEFIKQKEILFMKYDMKNIKKDKKTNYDELRKIYRRKLIDYGEIRELKNSYISKGNYKKVKGLSINV